jgi:3-oxoacyl-[acyl-carrier-protein] synthase-3
MAGPELFKIAVKTMEQAVLEVLKHEKLEVKDIDCLIPHQANDRILKAVADRLKIPHEKVFINVDRYGNMSSASTVVALYEAVKTGVVKKGDYVVLVAFGGGLTWAANLIKW